jgi:opacity protein-like surface antigen
MQSSIIKIVVFLSLVICSLSLNAQSYVSWDYYGIGFQVAQDFQVSQNDGNVFEASSSDRLLYVKVQPWTNSTVTVGDLYGYAVQYAQNLNYYLGAEVAGDYIEIDDFDGYFLVAATNDPRNYNYYLIAYLLDIESDTNYQVLIGYQEGHIDEAVNILVSFYAYD